MLLFAGLSALQGVFSFCACACIGMYRYVCMYVCMYVCIYRQIDS